MESAARCEGGVGFVVGCMGVRIGGHGAVFFFQALGSGTGWLVRGVKERRGDAAPFMQKRSPYPSITPGQDCGTSQRSRWSKALVWRPEPVHR